MTTLSNCPRCNGSGRMGVSCPRCGGDGESGQCPSCYGAGTIWVSCGQCAGSGASWTPALQIPDNVKRIAGDLIDVSISRETPHMIACMVLENFAPIIVATELRTLADEFHSGLGTAFYRMLERADQLDPPGGVS